MFLNKNKHPSIEGKINTKNMRKEIFSITWPSFIELVLSTMFGMVDMIMVGQLSSAAITSVGLTNQPFMLLLAIFAAVNVGTTTLVAWNIGGNHLAKARAVTRQILIVNAVLGIVMSIIGFVFASPVVIFMGANSDTLVFATNYFKIVSAGLFFQAITMGVTASLRGAGETKIPMLYNVGSNLLNVFGNYVLIYGKLGFPKLGVEGAAISTSISRLIACLMGLYTIYFSRKSIISIKFKDDYHIDFGILKKVFSVGLPAAIEQFVLQSGLMLFAKTVSSLGTEIFAAHQIGLNISGLSFSPSMAFSVAATTLVGQSLGAGDELKAEKYSKEVHRISLAVSIGVGLFFILFSHPIANLYTDEIVVAAMAGTVLKLLALALPGQSTQITIAGVLRGAGDTMYPLYASAIGIWGFRVVLAYVFVKIFDWGLNGAWIALVLDQYIRAAIVYIRYHSGKWKNARSRKVEIKKT